MEEPLSCQSRRALLVRAARFMPQGAFAVCSVVVVEAWAAKAAKQDFAYQDKPKQGKSCSTCRLYAPSEGGVGICALVEGDISPNGWCMAYSPRGE